MWMKRLTRQLFPLQRSHCCNLRGHWTKNDHFRHFGSNQSGDSTQKKAWRKYQLDSLSANLSKTIQSKNAEGDGYITSSQSDIVRINSDQELQQMWKEMESRVINRKMWTVEQSMSKGRIVGRGSVKTTDEEIWLEAGLYAPTDSNGSISDHETKIK